MDFTEYLMVFLLVTSVAGLINYFAGLGDGAKLQKKFIQLGTLTGLTLDQIVTVAGPANSVSALPDGSVLYQWFVTGYHISLIFQENICKGVSSETVIN